MLNSSQEDEDGHIAGHGFPNLISKKDLKQLKKQENKMSRFAPKKTITQPAAQVQKTKYPTILDVRMVDTKNGKKPKIQLAKGVTILLDGEPIDLGEYNSAFLHDQADMEKELEFKLEKGWIDEEKANAEADRIQEKGITYVFKHKLA